jgi:hypothetical protein
MTSGTIAVGQIITDTAGLIPSGTAITAFLGGSGGTGTYTLSTSYTVASETIYSIVPNLFKVSTTIAQIATSLAADITVTLQ